jgi:hypothetical protein
VRPDEDGAARLSALARSTGGFNRLRGWDARFAVAQDARGGDPSLVTTRNPVNFGLRASGRRALLGVYAMGREDAFWLDKVSPGSAF